MHPKVRHTIRFIINPISGARKKHFNEFQSLVEAYIDHDIFEPQYRLTDSEGHAVSLVKEGLAEGVGYFVAVGGDGTVNEVSQPLIGSDAIMGVIPAGSGNGLAHHLKIPSKIREAIEIINAGKVICIDTCFVNDKNFISIAGVGFDANVAKHYARVQQRGFMTYARMAAKEYFRYKPRKYVLILDGQKRKVSAFFISFANSNQFGYNAMIAPNASITDGKIDVCIASRPPVTAFPGLAHLMFMKRIDKSKYIETVRASKIMLSRKKGRTVNVDGEPIRMGKELHVRVRPASLNIIVP